MSPLRSAIKWEEAHSVPTQLARASVEVRELTDLRFKIASLSERAMRIIGSVINTRWYDPCDGRDIERSIICAHQIVTRLIAEWFLLMIKMNNII